MSKVLQNTGSVFVWDRLGDRLVIDGLPPELLPAGNVPAFVTSLSINDFDVTGKVICLNDKRVLYEFGKGFGTLKVDGELLIGPIGSGKTQTATEAKMGSIITWFNDNRVSAKADKQPLTLVTTDHGSFTFYASAFSINSINAEIGLVSFSIIGDLVSMEG
jgi:hypothetical protein